MSKLNENYVAFDVVDETGHRLTPMVKTSTDVRTVGVYSGENELAFNFSVKDLCKSVVQFYCWQGMRRTLQEFLKDSQNLDEVNRQATAFFLEGIEFTGPSKLQRYIVRAIQKLLEESGEKRTVEEIAAKSVNWTAERWETMAKRKDIKRMIARIKALEDQSVNTPDLGKIEID